MKGSESEVALQEAINKTQFYKPEEEMKGNRDNSLSAELEVEGLFGDDFSFCFKTLVWTFPHLRYMHFLSTPSSLDTCPPLLLAVIFF